MSDEKSRTVLTTILLSVSIVTLFQSVAFAEDQSDGQAPIVNFEFSDGAVISEFSTIRGTIQNEIAPKSATWELLDTSGTRYYVDISDDLSIDSELDVWNEWTFEIELDPISIGHCSCVARVVVEESNGNSIKFFQSIFISPDTSVIYQFPPTAQIISDHIFQWSGQSQTLEFISINFDSSTPTFSYLIVQSPSVKCSIEYMEIPSSANFFSPSEISEPASFRYDFDLANLSDGWFDVIIFAENSINQQFSYDCTTIRVDNNPPVVVIEAPSTVPEGMGYAIFDASSSYDDTWGIQGLTYIWSVVNSNEYAENGTMVVSGLDKRTLSLETIESGNYQVKLTIVDQAGNIGSAIRYLDVENKPPVVKLTIDGELFSDNSEFTLNRDSTCIIDASGSTDTQNDADSLRYVWRVNNIPTYEGQSREFSWPDGVEGDFLLTIEVIDDDYASSQISVLVKDDSEDPILPLSLILLALSVIFLSYAVVNMRKLANESDIPKWS